MSLKNLMVILLAGIAQQSIAAPLACLIEPEKVAEIGSQNVGVLEKITVERGDMVQAGQIVANIKADVERASVNVAQARAQAEADVRAAVAAHELMQRKFSRSKELFEQKFVSQEAVDQAEAEARIANNRVKQAQEAQRVAQEELALSNSQLAQRNIRSPFAGVVVDKYRTEGERIEREPILRIAKVDPLRVEVIMPADQFGQVQKGMSATVSTDLPGLKDLQANVTLIDRIIDAASNTFRVRLSLPNPSHSIPAGLRCKVAFNAASLPSTLPSPAKNTPGKVNMSSSKNGKMIKVSNLSSTTTEATEGEHLNLKLTPALPGKNLTKF